MIQLKILMMNKDWTKLVRKTQTGDVTTAFVLQRNKFAMIIQTVKTRVMKNLAVFYSAKNANLGKAKNIFSVYKINPQFAPCLNLWNKKIADFAKTKINGDVITDFVFQNSKLMMESGIVWTEVMKLQVKK